MRSFNKNLTEKTVHEEICEEDLNMQDKISLYSRCKQIIDGKDFITIYVDKREIEQMMELIRKGFIFSQ